MAVSSAWTANGAFTLVGTTPAVLGTIPGGSYGTNPLPLWAFISKTLQVFGVTEVLRLGVSFTDVAGHVLAQTVNALGGTDPSDGYDVIAGAALSTPSAVASSGLDFSTDVTVRVYLDLVTGTPTTYMVAGAALFQQDVFSSSISSVTRGGFNSPNSSGVESGTITLGGSAAVFGTIAQWGPVGQIPDYTGSAEWQNVVSRTSTFTGPSGSGVMTLGLGQSPGSNYNISNWPTGANKFFAGANGYFLLRPPVSRGRSFGTILGD